jgi:hypothetical protein
VGVGFFFIQKKSFAAHAEIKIAACCSLILKNETPEMLRSALKSNSGILFIGAEIFPCAVFQGNT